MVVKSNTQHMWW